MPFNTSIINIYINMNIPVLFFICLGVAILGLIVALVNLATTSKRFFSGDDGPRNIIVTHIIAAVLYGLGGFGTLAFGIAWIVTYLKQ